MEQAKPKRRRKHSAQLKQRVVAGQDHQAMRSVGCGPERRDAFSQFARCGVLPPESPVGSDEVGIAEPAYRRSPVDLAPAPEVTARESAEHRRHARLHAFALQGIEDFLDGVSHGPKPVVQDQRGSCRPTNRNRRTRRDRREPVAAVPVASAHAASAQSSSCRRLPVVPARGAVGDRAT